jgi:hypothetical protein
LPAALPSIGSGVSANPNSAQTAIISLPANTSLPQNDTKTEFWTVPGAVRPGQSNAVINTPAREPKLRLQPCHGKIGSRSGNDPKSQPSSSETASNAIARAPQVKTPVHQDLFASSKLQAASKPKPRSPKSDPEYTAEKLVNIFEENEAIWARLTTREKVLTLIQDVSGMTYILTNLKRALKLIPL